MPVIAGLCATSIVASRVGAGMATPGCGVVVGLSTSNGAAVFIRPVTPPSRPPLDSLAPRGNLDDERGPRGRAAHRHRPAERIDAVPQAEKS
jgi:hypothetical protein